MASIGTPGTPEWPVFRRPASDFGLGAFPGGREYVRLVGTAVRPTIEVEERAPPAGFTDNYPWPAQSLNTRINLNIDALSILQNNGTASPYRPYLNFIGGTLADNPAANRLDYTPPAGAAGFYQTVDWAGTPQVQRPTLNVIGTAGVSLVDNPGLGTTDLFIAPPAPQVPMAIGPIAPPVLSDWRWGNQPAGASWRQIGEGVRLQSPVGTGSDVLTAVIKNLPSLSNWTLVFAFSGRLFQKDFNNMGVGVRNSSNGRLESAAVGHDSGALSTNFNVRIVRHNSFTSFNTVLGTPLSMSGFPSVVWVKVVSAATTLSWFLSSNGFFAAAATFTTTKTDFIGTPDQVVLWMDPLLTTIPGLTLDLWSYQE